MLAFVRHLSLPASPTLTSELPDTADASTKAHVLQALLLTVFACLALSLTWFSLGDHPLAGRSEGRYAAVSRAMADGQGWLVPQLDGQPHLTKPPLTYWLEAASMRIFGPREFAVRLPSAIAGSATILGLLALGWRIRGPRVGMLAAGVLAIMPLQVALSRLTLTDALLGLFWFGTLASGYLWVHNEGSRRRNWLIAMWTCVAFGLFTKGPPALLPVLVLVIWLGLSQHWRMLGKMRLVTGIALACLPLVIWAALVWWLHPEAVDIWYKETISRAVGTGDHPKPIWFLLPVFLVGLFPATAMMSLPGLNFPIRQGWQNIRKGRGEALWALAVVVPLVIFSLNKGKLVSYLLPLCPPLALLTAMMLEQWLVGEADRPQAKRRRPPEVVATLFFCLAMAIGAAFIAVIWQFGASAVWMPLPGVALVLTAGWLWWSWKRKPQYRTVGLMAVWLAILSTFAYGMEIEDVLTNTSGDRQLVWEVQQKLHTTDLQLATVGFADPALSFYTGHPVPRLDDMFKNKPDLPAELQSAVLVVQGRQWIKLAHKHPDFTSTYEPVMSWPGKHDDNLWWVLRPAGEGKNTI